MYTHPLVVHSKRRQAKKKTEREKKRNQQQYTKRKTNNVVWNANRFLKMVHTEHCMLVSAMTHKWDCKRTARGCFLAEHRKWLMEIEWWSQKCHDSQFPTGKPNARCVFNNRRCIIVHCSTSVVSFQISVFYLHSSNRVGRFFATLFSTWSCYSLHFSLRKKYLCQNTICQNKHFIVSQSK